MEPIPQPVTHVSVYPYLPDEPIEVPPVFIDGTGKYSVGTLTTHIFYNLDLNSGSAQYGGVVAGGKYYAKCQGADGKTFNTPWMTCLQGGETPRFGRTISLLAPTPSNTPSPDIAYRIQLGNVSVDLYVSPTEPLVVPLIEGGTGIATFVGLLPGGTWSASVWNGKRINPPNKGMRVSISGTNVNGGTHFAIPAILVCEDPGNPAENVPAQFVQIK